MKQSADATQRGSELIGVVSGWVFKLLEKGIYGGADFGSVRGLCILTIRDVQRIHRHSRLFRGAFISKRDIFRVIGNALEHPQSNCLIVLHGRQPLSDSLRQRARRRCGRRHCIAIWIQFAHLI